MFEDPNRHNLKEREAENSQQQKYMELKNDGYLPILITENLR